MNITFTVYEKYNDASIAELELTDALEGILRKNDIHTVGDVVRHIEEGTLIGLNNFGVTKEKKVKNALFNFELYVSPNPVDFLMNCKVA